jgi:hypothetical protein
MSFFDHRQFLQISAAALMTGADAAVPGEAQRSRIAEHGGGLLSISNARFRAVSLPVPSSSRWSLFPRRVI